MKNDIIEFDNIKTEGIAISKSWWGKKWCKNIEELTSNRARLERARTYVRKNHVLYLSVSENKLESLITNDDYDTYKVNIEFKAFTDKKKNSIIKTFFEQGMHPSLFDYSMPTNCEELFNNKNDGILPNVEEVEYLCTCADYYAYPKMCKHILATLYAFGHLLDHNPKLIFVLRGINLDDLKNYKSKFAQDYIWESLKRGSKRKMSCNEANNLFGFDFEEFDDENEINTFEEADNPIEANDLNIINIREENTIKEEDDNYKETSESTTNDELLDEFEEYQEIENDKPKKVVDEILENSKNDNIKETTASIENDYSKVAEQIIHEENDITPQNETAAIDENKNNIKPKNKFYWFRVILFIVIFNFMNIEFIKDVENYNVYIFFYFLILFLIPGFCNSLNSIRIKLKIKNKFIFFTRLVISVFLLVVLLCSLDPSMMIPQMIFVILIFIVTNPVTTTLIKNISMEAGIKVNLLYWIEFVFSGIFFINTIFFAYGDNFDFIAMLCSFVITLLTNPFVLKLINEIKNRV